MTPADIKREYTHHSEFAGYAYLDTDAMAAEIARLREVVEKVRAIETVGPDSGFVWHEDITRALGDTP